MSGIFLASGLGVRNIYGVGNILFWCSEFFFSGRNYFWRSEFFLVVGIFFGVVGIYFGGWLEFSVSNCIVIAFILQNDEKP